MRRQLDRGVVMSNKDITIGRLYENVRTEDPIPQSEFTADPAEDAVEKTADEEKEEPVKTESSKKTKK